MITLQTPLAALLFLVVTLAAPINTSQNGDVDVTAARTSLNHHSEPMPAVAAEIYKRPDTAHPVDEVFEARTTKESASISQNKFPRDDDDIQGWGIAPKVLETIAPAVEYVADLM